MLSAWVLSSTGPICAQQQQQRVVQTEPRDGHCVEVPSGYMVPYTATIPGTDVSFQMIPVPGIPADKVPPFWIGKYEVTLREYREFASLYTFFTDPGNKKLQRTPEGRGVDAVSAPTPIYNPAERFEGVASLDCPAYSMTMFAAKQYTKWLSLITTAPYRLPMEAEWEHACRAGGGGYFWNDEQLRKVAVFGAETDNVLPVGSREPNAWGIHDTHGNVSEWVITAHPQQRVDQDNHDQPSGARTWPPTWISKGGNFASLREDCLPRRRFVVTAEEWDEEANYPRSTTWLGSHSDRVRIGFRVVSEPGELKVSAMAKYWGAETRSYRDQIEIKLRGGRGAEGLVGPELPEFMEKTNVEPPRWIVPKSPTSRRRRK